MRHVFFKPAASAGREENGPLFISFSDYVCFTRFEIDHHALHVERFRYSHAGSDEHFNQCPASEPAHIKTLIAFEDWNSREKPLNFLRCEKHDIAPRDAWKTDRLRIKNNKIEYKPT